MLTVQASSFTAELFTDSHFRMLCVRSSGSPDDNIALSMLSLLLKHSPHGAPSTVLRSHSTTQSSRTRCPNASAPLQLNLQVDSMTR